SLFIEHPWYKTTWFKFLLALLAILLIWGISAWRNHYLRIRNRMLQKTVDIQVQEINHQKEELETQLEKLEKDYAMKNRLISMIGHDIITPLRFMSSAGNKLLHHKESISQETYDDVVKTMVETGNNLKDMSTNMLNWIKHHSQNVSFEPETFDLHEKVQQVVTNVVPMAKFKNIAINNRSMENVQMTQFAEPLKNIIFQLVSNSIKYCNGGTIDISSKIINENLQLVIKDDGPGMTAPQIEHLTGNGKSGTFTSTHENKGHGFGYLIIKDMLNIIKGSMGIAAERNKGTEVTITLPINASK
ncbi:MAG: HAMP domain-containing histidine kinase, partial [Sphingobacteriales bacterium]